MTTGMTLLPAIQPFVRSQPRPMVVTLVALGLCAEVARLAALGIGASRRQDGPMGKSDRAIVFGLIGLIGLILALDNTAAPWLPWLLIPASVMALATIGNRMRTALHEIPGEARANRTLGLYD